MTAMNAFGRPDGAWLLSDAAGFRQSGHIHQFHGKVSSDERLRLAIGTSGTVEIGAQGDIQDWMSQQPSQAKALSELPHLLAMLTGYASEAGENGAYEDNDLPRGIRLTIAYWDHFRQVGRVALMADCEALSGGAPVGTLRGASEIFSPRLEANPWPRKSFDPRSDARRLADLQRRTVDEFGVHRVGGCFEVVRVHRDGIEQSIVHRWPDRIGAKIKVAA